MKLEKKHYIIIVVVIALIAIWYFFLRKKPATSSYVRLAPSTPRVSPRVSPMVSNYSANDIESGFTSQSACKKLGCTGYKNGRCSGCRLRGESTGTGIATGESAFDMMLPLIGNENGFAAAPRVSPRVAPIVSSGMSVPIPGSGGMCCSQALSGPTPQGTMWCNGKASQCMGLGQSGATALGKL